MVNSVYGFGVQSVIISDSSVADPGFSHKKRQDLRGEFNI